jgi:hypothetical protein
MKEIITKYFHNVDEFENDFKFPVAEEELAKIESQLDFVLPDDYKIFYVLQTVLKDSSMSFLYVLLQ